MKSFPVTFYLRSKKLDRFCLTRKLLAIKKSFQLSSELFGGRRSSMVLSVPTILRPGFESQAHQLHFFQFVLLKLLLDLEKDKSKQKEAMIGPYF